MSISEKEYDAAYQEWHDSREMEGVNTDELQARIIEELTFVRSMPVEEYTLFTNWADIKERFPTEETSTLFGSEVVMKNQSKKLLHYQVQMQARTLPRRLSRRPRKKLRQKLGLTLKY